jgi:hypothetical protein
MHTFKFNIPCMIILNLEQVNGISFIQGNSDSNKPVLNIYQTF